MANARRFTPPPAEMRPAPVQRVRLRIQQPWAGYPVGYIYEALPGEAELLLERGVAERVADDTGRK